MAYRPLQKALDPALEELGDDAPRVVWVEEGDAEDSEYEQLLAGADPIDLERPDDERTLISINYTSGTTGRPKGVMTNHRGAYLHALGVIAEARLTPRSSYLWTLPMFHCNGWAYPWAVTAMGAKHVCLPKVEAKPIWNALTKEGVTHLCAAPTVLTTIVGADEAEPLESEVFGFVGGAPPSPTLLEQAAKLKLQITHLYGLTETYGPLAVCAWNPDWDDLADDEQAKLRSRQGVGTVVSREAARRRRGHGRRARRRRDARRGRHARRQRDDGLLPRRGRARARRSRAGGFTPATSASCTRTATSSCATASRT